MSYKIGWCHKLAGRQCKDGARPVSTTAITTNNAFGCISHQLNYDTTQNSGLYEMMKMDDEIVFLRDNKNSDFCIDS